MLIGIKEAERKARAIHESRGYIIPLNVTALAEEFGIAVQPRELADNISGMLAVRGEHAVMHINKNHHGNRKRFTVAHEIGHFVLHRSQSEVFVDAFYRNDDSSKGINPEEIQANAFAAELLMPEKVLREKLSVQPLDVFDEEALTQLAEEFEVSPQALAIRLTRLNLVSV